MTAPSEVDVQLYGIADGKGYPAHQKCRYGDEPATKRVVWADGRAYVPVCDNHLAKAKGELSDVVAVHPIPSAAHSLATGEDHAACLVEAELYGAAYCLATRKPGPCVGTHRPGTILKPPTPIRVPAAPIAPTDQQRAAQAQADAGYRQAYLAAQQVAVGAGLPGARHGEVAGAMNDYAHALHGHQQAEAHAAAAYQRAQAAHDTAEKRQAAQTASYKAREAAAEARAAAAAARASLHRAARHAARKTGPVAAPAGFAANADPYGVPMDFQLYGLVSWAHQDCDYGAFCRNPLHPGPCKGWKHMLHAVAPGAYHAYEKQRVAKLNEKRQAKIKALEALGHPVPKHLLKEITYAQVPKAPEGAAPFTPPTPKEAVAKLPATAKEIGEKIGLKHAALAQAKLDAQHQALVKTVEALAPGSAVAKQAAGPVVKKKLADAAAAMKPGEKLSEQPVVKKTIDGLAEKASQVAGGLSSKEKADIAADIAAHVDQGIAEPPQLVTSAINQGKEKEAAAQAAMEKAAHVSHAQVFLDSYKKVDWTSATPTARNKAYGQMGDILTNPHTTPEQKADAKAIQQDIAAALHKITSEPTDAKDLKLKQAAALHGVTNALGLNQPLDAVESAVEKAHAGLKPGQKLSEAPGMGSVISHLANQALKKYHDQGLKSPGISAVHKDIADHVDGGKPGLPAHVAQIADSGKPDLAAEAKAILGKQGVSLTDKAGQLTKAHFDATPEADQKKLIDQLKDVEADAGHEVSVKASKLIAKLSGTGLVQGDSDLGTALTAINMGLSAHDILVALDKPGVTKAQYDLLTGSGKAKVKAALAQHYDASPATAESIAEKLGISKVDIKSPMGSVTPAAPLGPDVPAHVKAAQSLATGAKYGTATAKTAAYEKLTKEEYNSLPLHVQQGIHNDLHAAAGKFVDPKKKAAVAAVLNKLGMPTEYPHGAGAPHGSAVTHEKYVEAWDAAKHLAVGEGLFNKVSAKKLVEGTAPEQMPAHAEVISHGLAQAWADKHLSDLPLSADEKDTIRAKAKTEIRQMLDHGETEPPPGGVMQVAKAIGPDWAVAKAQALKVAAGLPVNVEEPHPTGAGAGGPSVPHVPASGPAAPKKSTIGKGKSIAKMSAETKSHILDAYKAHGAAAYLDAAPADSYQALLNTAHALHGQPGVGSLSLSQVIDAVDEQMAAKAGVANGNLLRKKITDWLATPEGAKAAKAIKPNLGKVEDIKPPKVMKPGEIVPTVGGPGKYKATDTGFVPRTHSEMLNLQGGHQWTPDQLAAIKSYTSSGYSTMNTYLRTGKGGSPNLHKRVEDLQSAMLPLKANSQLVRGTGWSQFPPGFQSPEAVKGLVGKTISDPAFVSTATAGSGSGFSSNPVRMEIEAPKGTMGIYVEHVTSVSGEYEFLLAAGTKFRVLSVTQEGGKTVVKVRVIS